MTHASFGRRRDLLAAAALGLALLLPGRGHAGEMPVIRPVATVSGAVVRLGDLVAHAGIFADIPLFRAPDPGTTGPVDTAAVVAAARQAGLTGIDTGGLVQVEVTRASRSIGGDEVIAVVRRRLARAAGVTDPANLAVTIDPADLPLLLPVTATGTPRVSDTTWSAADGSFQAVVEVAAHGGNVRRVISGHAVQVAKTVVATHDIARGDILGPDDVQVVRRPRAALASNGLIAVAAAIGFEATHTLREGDPLRATDVAEPELVRRGDLVTVVFRAPGMTLTLRGRALRSGRRGDTVNVMNLQSNRILQGTVDSTGQVVLTPAHPPVTTALR